MVTINFAMNKYLISIKKLGINYKDKHKKLTISTICIHYSFITVTFFLNLNFKVKVTSNN